MSECKTPVRPPKLIAPLTDTSLGPDTGELHDSNVTTGTSVSASQRPADSLRGPTDSTSDVIPDSEARTARAAATPNNPSEAEREATDCKDTLFSDLGVGTVCEVGDAKPHTRQAARHPQGLFRF